MGNASIWQVRATAWELLSLSFAYPTHDVVAAVASGEWVDAAQEIANALGLELATTVFDGLDAYVGADEEALFHRLRTEATRLFVGAPDPVVSPYEGVWRAEDDGVQPLLFVNPHSMEVERFMRQCSLGRPEGTNEPLDHAGTECSLLEFLAGVEAGIMALPEGVDAASLPGGSAEAAYAEFLEDHAQTWMPRFAAKTAEEAREPFYRAASALLTALLKTA